MTSLQYRKDKNKKTLETFRPSSVLSGKIAKILLEICLAACFVFIRHLLSCKAEIFASWQHRRRRDHVDQSRGMAQQWPGHPNQLFAAAVVAVAATAAAHSHYDSSPRHNVRSYMSLHSVRILLQVKAGWLRYCNMKQSMLHYASSCMKSTDALVPARVPAVTEGC